MAAKLSLSFILLISMVTLVDWVALTHISQANVDLDRMVEAHWERVQLARQAQFYSNLNGRIILQCFMDADAREIQELLAEANANSAKISEIFQELSEEIQTSEERKLLDDIIVKRKTYQDKRTQALELLLQKNDAERARRVMTKEALPRGQEYQEAMDTYVAHQGRALTSAEQANLSTSAKARRQALWLISLATLFAVAIAIFITRDTSKQMRRRLGAEKQLQLAHDELEAKVHNRTARLFESEQRYRLLFDSNPLPMWVFDLETLNFVAVNDAAIRHYGYSREEFLSMTLTDIRPAEDVIALHQVRKSSSGQCGDAPGVWRHRKKDGTIIDVEISWHTLEFADRRAKLVLAKDITERLIAEAEADQLHAQLENEQRRLNDILANLPGIVWESRSDGAEGSAPTFVSDYVEKMLGYTPQEWLALPGGWLAAVHPDDRDSVGDDLAVNEDGGASDFRWITKDGRTVFGESRKALIYDDAGRVIGARGVTLDITERKTAEIDFLIQTARFQQLFANAPMGIVMVDEQDRVLKANDSFMTMFQLSADEVRGHLINDLIVPAELAVEARELSAQTFALGIVQTEAVRKRKDGVLIPVQIYGVPIVANDKLVGIFAIYIDLTERKRLEHERQVIFDIIQGAIATTDLNDLFSLIHESISKVLYAENCFVALHDPETDSMHYEFWRDKYDPAPEPRAVGMGFGSHVLRTGQPMLLTEEVTAAMVESGIVKKSGTSSPSWLGVPLRTASRVIGVLAVQHYEDKDAYTQADLQFLNSVGSQIALAIERRRAQQALLDASRQALIEYASLIKRIAALGQTLGTARDLTIIFRALRDFAVASVPCDGMVISLYDADKASRRVAYCWADNQEFEPETLSSIPVRNGLTGRAIESGTVIIENDFQSELSGKNAVLIGSFDDDKTPRSALSAPMAVMGRIVGCVEIQSYAAGAYRQEHATAMRMGANLAANAIENVALIEREQEKAEQLRQAQKMESIGTLAGGIAHDFNNLMTAVTGYSELGLMSLDPADPIRPKLEEIKKAGERAASLTRQLLAFSRKQMLQPKVLDLNSVIKGTAKMLTRLIGEHIELQLGLEESLGKIKADPGQIEQVLLNLAVNARDAMPEGGHLRMQTGNVQFHQRFKNHNAAIEPGQYVVLAVTDTGCGMDAETQTQIFEPFFTTKGVGKGTGLGLSTAYGIIKQSGGEVWVYSEVNKGTTFKVYLPRVDKVDSAEVKTEPAAQAERGKETVLLVEDEEQVRNLTKEILEAYGYSVLCAADGLEGLRLGREFEGEIDLIVTDVIMPHMSGRELIDRLRPIRPYSKVLYMSGFTDDAIVHHGVLQEGVFFLEKPFSTEIFANKVREVLDQ